MGERLYDITQINLKDVHFKVELNAGTANSNKCKYIHIQNPRFRLSLSDSEYIEMAVAIRAANNKIKRYGDDISCAKIVYDNDEVKLIEPNLVEYAYLENDRILIDEIKSKDVMHCLKKNGWKPIKMNKKDLFLYGMKPFEYMKKGNEILTVCCQIACKSTLHGEWIPLDRMINVGALERSSDHRLCPEDDICYILAKCVYTNRRFSERDIKRIGENMLRADKDILLKKLGGVFFEYVDDLLRQIENRNYDNIISNLWQYDKY